MTTINEISNHIMITEELKHTLDSLPSGVHEQARELVKTWKTAHDRIINEIFELSEEEDDELQQIADEAKGKLFTLLFGPPNKQNQVYHLTNPNTNPIHLITNPYPYGIILRYI